VLFGFGSLVLALGTGLAQLAMPGLSLRGWVAYAVLTLLGWLVVFITGIWYRLLGFLLWLHFHRPRGGRPVRTAAELVHRPTAWAALAFLAGGVLGLVAAVGLGSGAGARAGAGAVLAGSLLIAAQYVRIYAERVMAPSLRSG
jgi:hypothetical protein